MMIIAEAKLDFWLTAQPNLSITTSSEAQQQQTQRSDPIFTESSWESRINACHHVAVMLISSRLNIETNQSTHIKTNISLFFFSHVLDQNKTNKNNNKIIKTTMNRVVTDTKCHLKSVFRIWNFIQSSFLQCSQLFNVKSTCRGLVDPRKHVYYPDCFESLTAGFLNDSGVPHVCLLFYSCD